MDLGVKCPVNYLRRQNIFETKLTQETSRNRTRDQMIFATFLEKKNETYDIIILFVCVAHL
jgi:hypothetical protein